MYLVVTVTRLPWQPWCYVNGSFVLSLVEVVFGMGLSLCGGHRPHTLLL